MAEAGLETPTNFQNILGSSPTIKIIDFFMENTKDKWALSEIRDNANVSYSSVKSIIPRLLDKDIIRVGRTVGKINFYVFDLNNPISEKLCELRDLTNEREVKRAIESDGR